MPLPKICLKQEAAQVSSPVPNSPAMASTTPCQESTESELLGSLTTEQQQRTSARVIKKLRLDNEGLDSGDKKAEAQECIGEKDAGLSGVDKCEKEAAHAVKRRINWSAVEKSLFFEAINEHGKDFDAVTSYINAKLKKKGCAGSGEKTKTQVAHFYYRTWHKLSKYLHFDDSVKKVAQELYTLINYGEMRKKLVMDKKKNWPLFEMICNGVAVVKAKGRNFRVRTPMCQALRRLNGLTDDSAEARVPCRVVARCVARDSSAWARVQACAHNPRLSLHVAPRVQLHTVLTALENRWSAGRRDSSDSFEDKADSEDTKNDDELKSQGTKDTAGVPAFADDTSVGDARSQELDCNKNISSNHLGLPPDRLVTLEQSDANTRLHVGPKSSAKIHLPTISFSRASRDISYLAYLNREGLTKEDGCSGSVKIKTPKRQRKDSTTDRESDNKKVKVDDDDGPSKLIDIDEAAIDGIELMASLNESKVAAGSKTSENEDSNNLTDREMDVDNKGCTDYDSLEKCHENSEDKHSIVTDEEKCTPEKEGDNPCKEEDKRTDDEVTRSKLDEEIDKNKESDLDEDRKPSDKIIDQLKADLKDSSSETDDSDVDPDEHLPVIKKKVQKFSNLKVKFRIRTRKRNTLRLQTDTSRPTLGAEEIPVRDVSWDRELVARQAARGWSVLDAGHLSIGDLYLMFGHNSKLDLEYWWTEAHPPLPANVLEQIRNRCMGENEKSSPPEKPEDKSKCAFERALLDLDEEKRESDCDILSPRNTFSQDSNDGASGDEKKVEVSSPEHKQTRYEYNISAPLRIASKLINNPNPNIPLSQIIEGNYGSPISSNVVPPREQVITLTTRLQRLISLANLYSQPSNIRRTSGGIQMVEELHQRDAHSVFVAPTAPSTQEGVKQQANVKTVRLEELTRWSRRTQGAPMVVRRPLVPTLDTASTASNDAESKKSSSTPVKINAVPDGLYMMKKINDRFFIVSGDKKLPVNVRDIRMGSHENGGSKSPSGSVKSSRPSAPSEKRSAAGGTITNFLDCISLPSIDNESVDGNDDYSSGISTWMSPSRLLRGNESATWLDTTDCSLSSLLNQLEQTKPPAEVDSQVECMLAESSNDFITKFADLAAEVDSDSKK